MKVRAAGLAAFLVLFGSSLAAAGPVVDAATKAEALQAQGRTVQALDALDEAVNAICGASAVAFRKVVVVESSDGYGVYAEKSDKSFKPDDKLRIYVEPVCLGSGSDGKMGFKADIAIENMTGQVLGEAKDVLSVSAPARREFSATLSFGVPYLRPADYKAVFTVHDQNSDKTGTFEVPFTITLPAVN